MKIWVDDVRPRPDNQWYWVHSVNEFKELIKSMDSIHAEWDDCTCGIIDLIDIDHDAGDYAYDGGDYIEILNWLEETGRNYPIRIHSMNPVGRENMRRIIQRNGWAEVM